MSDEAVARLLRSDERLVLIEASAGCGKTYQGANYAKDVIKSIDDGRLLILTHTHAACSVFAGRTYGAGSRVEIKTIDALIARIATAYHKPLGLPHDVASWAWKSDDGFGQLAAKVAAYLQGNPMIARSLAYRYPIIICDEHQDSSEDQHNIVMSLYQNGAKLRVFGDPLQRIYGSKPKVIQQDRSRWSEFRSASACEKLDHPHRWSDGCQKLGSWILNARECLEKGQPIDLTGTLPSSLTVLVGNNIAQARTDYWLSKDEKKPIDRLVRDADQIMILASQNEQVKSSRSFFWRTVPIWEGHVRTAFAELVRIIDSHTGNSEALAAGLVTFMGKVAVGFSNTSHGNKLIEEVKTGAAKKRKEGKPRNIQYVAKSLVNDPSHTGVAAALTKIHDLVKSKAIGFDEIKIDHYNEFRDGCRMGQFSSANEAFTEISRMRSYTHPRPPQRVISSIHKAKGLECDNVLLMACDKGNFTNTDYSICKLYVALSRAKKSLTLVVSKTNPSPLFNIR